MPLIVIDRGSKDATEGLPGDVVELFPEYSVVDWAGGPEGEHDLR